MPDTQAAQLESLAREFPVSLAAHERRSTHYDTRGLLDIAACRNMLDGLGPVIGSRTRPVTASLLAKRVAFLVTGPALYAMSAYDQGLDLRMGNCITDVTHEGGLWRSHLILKTLATDQPTPRQREPWRERVIERVFSGHLAPLWMALHHASGISSRILWENTAVRVYSLYERRMVKLPDCAARSRAQDDFRYLVQDAPGNLFGLSENPLKRFFFKPRSTLTSEGQPRELRVRKTCCLYFMATEPAEYCSACPLLHKR